MLLKNSDAFAWLLYLVIDCSVKTKYSFFFLNIPVVVCTSARELGIPRVSFADLRARIWTPGARPVLVTAGTATSDRGKRHHRGANFFNVVHVRPGAFAVEEHRFDPATGAFAPAVRRAFDR